VIIDNMRLNLTLIGVIVLIEGESERKKRIHQLINGVRTINL